MDKVKQNIIQQQQLDKFNIEKSVVGIEAYHINQDIQKGVPQDEIIEKARSGVYKLTAENKKAGRVGQRYGERRDENGAFNIKGHKTVYDSSGRKVNKPKESIDKKEDKFPSKDKLIEKLISWGNNDEKSKEMVEEHYDYVKRVYPDSSLRELATVIRTIY